MEQVFYIIFETQRITTERKEKVEPLELEIT
jgi:hypothetical protein